MQRLQSAPAPAAAEAVPDLPFPSGLEIRTLPLLERLDALREPGVSQREVDLFLEGLSAILPEHEPPRVRADLMLDVLEDSRLCELTGSDGTRVGSTALEVLLELGYPYALEVTPSMLDRVRAPERSPTPRSVFVGMGVAGFTGLLYLQHDLPRYLRYLELLSSYSGPLPQRLLRNYDPAVLNLPTFLAVLLGPAVLTGMTWLFNWRRPRPFANVLHGLSGGWALWAALMYQLPAMVPFGLLTFVSAYCMRARPEPLPPASPPARP